MENLGAPLAGLALVTTPPVTPVPLDELDLLILTRLAAAARASQRSLARDLGMSAPAIGERIARMERAGVIRGYSVVLDWEAAGLPVVIYLAITAAQGHDLGAVIEALTRLAEVEHVTVVTGDLDLLARLRVRDYTHLRAVLLDKVWQISGVQRTETYLAIAEGPAKNFTKGLIESGLTIHGNGNSPSRGESP